MSRERGRPGKVTDLTPGQRFRWTGDQFVVVEAPVQDEENPHGWWVLCEMFGNEQRQCFIQEGERIELLGSES